MATWKLPPLPPMPKAVPSAPLVNGTGVEVTGADELIARLMLLPQVCTAAAMQSMLDTAGEIIEDSKDNYCPFLSGDLRSTGEAFVTDDGGAVILQFGGPGSPAEAYALEQHENMSYHHNIGGPKYLERAVDAHTQELIENVGASLRATLEVTSSGWASGDWKQIRVLHDQRSNLRVVRGYMRKSGKQVAPYVRRKR